jgi:hypothetical protein
VRHFDDSKKPVEEREGIPAPEELTLGNSLGDNRMLVAGGLLDQPYALWTMAQHAASIWSLLERWSSRNEHSQFSDHEVSYMRDVIDPIRGIKRGA